jgi:trimeric autotransporter adhesin
MLKPGDIARRWLVPAGAASLSGLAFASAALGAATVAAPVAITGPVTATGSQTATLSGIVNPNGVSTSWQFQYGKTPTYGSSTTALDAGTGSVNTGVSASLTGLAPGTTYHYRLVAMSSGGVTDGADGIFTTPASTSAAPGATTGPASAIGAAGATLNGSVTPNGQATTYSFQYGTSTVYGAQTSPVSAGSGTTPIAVSATIAGLKAGGTYHYRLVATSSAGTTDGADLTFTPAAAPAGPTATTKPASSVGQTGAKLNGSIDPNGHATSYYFEYGTSTGYGSKTAVAGAGSGTKALAVSATLSGLSVGVYHFRLVATSAAGTADGADLTFGSAVPPVVQTGSAEGASTSGATLTGTVNPGGAATSWYFQYGTTSSYGQQTPSRSAGSGGAVTGVSATIGKLAAGTSYHYRLVGASSAGTVDGGDVTFQTVPAVTLATETVALVYGQTATLSGAVFTRQTGVTVTLLAEPYGATTFSPVGSSKTGIGGSWTYQAKPTVQTAYEASIQGGASTPVAVGVRPAITLRVITGARLTARAVAAASFAGKRVQLQVLVPGNRWETIATAPLNSRSAAIFKTTKLRRGSSQLRIAMSVNQAGAGYLAGFSRTLSYRRR